MATLTKEDVAKVNISASREMCEHCFDSIIKAVRKSRKTQKTRKTRKSRTRRK